MNCVYQYSNVVFGNESRSYFERMDKQDNVVPLFSDSIALLTITDEKKYCISNIEGEDFFIGETGLKGAEKHLKQFENIKVFVNGMSRVNYEAFQNVLKENENGKEEK